jgi:hypothetical protein
MTRPSVIERLHEWMHDLPGVPDHSEAQRLNHRGGLQGGRLALRHRPFRNRHFRNTDAVRQPRVLVAWQNAIADFLARRGR